MQPLATLVPDRLSGDHYRAVIGHFASGVTVITTHRDGVAHGTTASAVTSLSLEPPMLVVCLNQTSETGAAIAATGRFGVNVLGEDQREAAVCFAAKGPTKFEGVMFGSGPLGQPLFEDALAVLECRVVKRIVGGTHIVFLAEVDHASAREGRPLAYFRGGFCRLQNSATTATPRHTSVTTD